jgi:hypothetical protein
MTWANVLTLRGRLEEAIGDVLSGQASGDEIDEAISRLETIAKGGDYVVVFGGGEGDFQECRSFGPFLSKDLAADWLDSGKAPLSVHRLPYRIVKLENVTP